MAVGQTPQSAYHTCSCGKSFDTTEDLLAHAREVHGFTPY
jgi:hypothetical protein